MRGGARAGGSRETSSAARVVIGANRLPVRRVVRFAGLCFAVAVLALANAAGALGFGQVPGSPFFAVGLAPVSLAFSPSGGLLATANFDDSDDATGVSVFSVGADGSLTQVTGSPFNTGGPWAWSIAFSPSGMLLAVGNAPDPDGGGNSVSVFSVGADGTLTQVTGSPFDTAGEGYESVAFSPNGALLAAASYGSSNLSMFSVGADGALTPVSGSPFPTGSLPGSVAFSPDGALLATANTNSKSVSVFSVGSGGALTPVTGSPFSTGSAEPGSVAFSPSGALLAASTSSSVVMFSVDPDGALSQVPGSPFGTGGSETLSAVFSPSGALLATPNYGSDNMSVFTVAPSGALTQVSGSPFGTGLAAVSAAFSPDGTLLATANTGVSVFSTALTPPAPGWAGGDQSANWSLADNWSSDTTPSGSLGTLSFLDLGNVCDDGASSTTCYASEDDLGDLTADQLAIADDRPYVLDPETAGNDSLTLNGDSSSVGLEAGPSEVGSPDGIPDVAIPIELGANQRWEIGGENAWPSPYGLEVDDVSGASDSVGVTLLNATLYTTSMDTNVSAGAAGYNGTIVVEPNPNDPGDQPFLESVSLSQGAGLQVAAANTGSDGLAAGIEAGNNNGFGYGADVSIGAGSAPDGTLDVNGDVTLGGAANLTMYVDQPASLPPTPTPSADYAQLSASGSITLGDAGLTLDLGTDSDSNCDDLVPGQVYTLISAGTISGEFDYNGSPLTDGETIALANDCDSASAPTATINYNTSSTPETVTATVIAGGHAGDVPTLTGAFPTISGTPSVGSPLQATTGGWSESPTSYDYAWYSCSAAAGPDCDNAVGGDAPTYTPTANDAGDTIEVCVSAINSYGTNSSESCSDPTAVATIPSPPINTGSPPSIEGTDQPGDTLTATPGGWSSLPAFTYQWQLCGTQGGNCTNIQGATGSSYTLTSSDVGQYVRLQVTATNAGGSTVGYSTIYGQVTTVPSTPPAAPGPPPAATASSTQIMSALSAIAHPSDKKAIAAVVRNGSFKASFQAPAAGSLSVTWTTRVTSGKGKHKKHKTVTIANGSASTNLTGTISVTIHLTKTGKSLLKKKPSGLSTTAIAKFKPNGLTWILATNKFNL